MADPIKFTEDVRSTYLMLLAGGMGKFEAAKVVKIHYVTIQRYQRAHQEFRDEVDAALGQANEKVSNKLYEAALAGEPWAIKFWLEKRAAAEFGATATIKHEHSGAIEIEPGKVMLALTDLHQQLAERHAFAALTTGEPPAADDPDITEAELLPMPVPPSTLPPRPQ